MRLLSLLGLGLLAAACAPKTDTPTDAVPAAPTALSAEELDAVRAVEPAFAAAMNAKDTAAVLAFYAADARLMPPDAPALEGDGIRAMIVGMFDAGATDFVLTPTTTYGVGDLAYQLGTATYSMGGATHQIKFLEVLRKGADGKWRYVADMFSGVAPAGEM
ncbi:MAG TPA: DUF4440 domain-containing protein [Gemmatimonadales bacterium]|nr:DUF4440 domain-containing protein [Gemmatimonadales bacterium]